MLNPAIALEELENTRRGMTLSFRARTSSSHFEQGRIALRMSKASILAINIATACKSSAIQFVMALVSESFRTNKNIKSKALDPSDANHMFDVKIRIPVNAGIDP